MSDKWQNNQLQMTLAFTGEGRSEAPRARREGTESLTAERRTESPAREEQRMEEVCEQQNCLRALKRVKGNQGSPGIDGITVEELPGYLVQHWPAIREQLLSGSYRPQPVRRVEIPKPDGGVRKLETHPESPSPGSGIRNQKNTKKILKKGLTNWHIYVIT